MERTFRGVRVTGDRIVHGTDDHPLTDARASVKTPAALRRDAAAGRITLDEATQEVLRSRRGESGLFLVVTGDGFTMAVPVPVRKGSDARTFASRLNTAANRLSLNAAPIPVSEVSTIGERYTVGSRVAAPKFQTAESLIPEPSHHPGTETTGWSSTRPTGRTPASAPAASSGPATSRAATGPAGWFPDPTHRFTHRYWDGAQWTEHVARNGIRSRDPITGPGQSTVTRSTAGVDPLSGAISSFFGR